MWQVLYQRVGLASQTKGHNIHIYIIIFQWKNYKTQGYVYLYQIMWVAWKENYLTPFFLLMQSTSRRELLILLQSPQVKVIIDKIIFI